MSYPSFESHDSQPRAGGPVTCAACGCRLRPVTRGGREAWLHFSPMAGRDARGCRIDCAELAHDEDGRVLADVVAA